MRRRESTDAPRIGVAGRHLRLPAAALPISLPASLRPRRHRARQLDTDRDGSSASDASAARRFLAPDDTPSPKLRPPAITMSRAALSSCRHSGWSRTSAVGLPTAEVVFRTVSIWTLRLAPDGVARSTCRRPPQTVPTAWHSRGDVAGFQVVCHLLRRPASSPRHSPCLTSRSPTSPSPRPGLCGAISDPSSESSAQPSTWQKPNA